ncbi:hypothetical protein RCH06_002786 [Polaromonas sp. CG_9.5]|uniref:hypothetical protein n=1 Tax=Polaromonas sp. CG_9.5 TaxID=3071705 RepID=UPI002E05D723|nr:hypothetical protein [Polaromonas sp. CG_9.5]
MNRESTRVMPATPDTAATGVPAGWTSQRTAWLIFGPPAFMVAVRWLVQLADDRQSTIPALALVPVSTTTGLADLLWPVAVVLALLVVAAVVIYRLGWQRVMPAIGAVWLLLWLAGSGAMLERHFNQQGLFLQDARTSASPSAAPVKARVVTSKFKPPSLRSLGGTELVLQVASLEIPQRLLIDDVRAAPLKPGDTLALQFSPGRFSGRFVTAWQAIPTTRSP